MDSIERKINIDLSETQGQIEWLKQKIYLNTQADSAGRRTVKRGQVYRCNLGMGVGNEMRKDRPCVIVQNDIANLHSPNTFIVPITHGTASIPTMIPIAAKYDSAGNMILDGSANVSSATCVSKARLGNYVCNLSNSEMKLIDEAIAKTFDIMHYYSDIKNKYSRQAAYTATVKDTRNHAEDKLAEIQTVLNEEKSAECMIEEIKNIFKKD